MLKPNNGVVLVRIDKPEEVSPGGIALVIQTDDEPHRVAEVVAVGDGCNVDPGEKVIFARDVGQETETDGETLIAILDDDILGVVE